MSELAVTRGEAILAFYANSWMVSKEPPETIASDLITDVLHACVHQNAEDDAYEIIQRALRDFNEEREEEP